MTETGVSYFTGRTLRHAQADLEDIARHNCSYVVHCYSETDLYFYRKTFAEIVKATHDLGLKVWLDPWGVARVFSGETLSRFPLVNPDALQILSDGSKAAAACPNHRVTRDFLLDWVRAAAEAGGDTVLWDEPHFFVPFLNGIKGSAWACRCDECRRRFREQAGHEMPEALDEEVLAFRESSLRELIGELAAEARRLGMLNTLCLFPSDLITDGFSEPCQLLARVTETPLEGNPMRQFGFMDWDAAAAIPNLDIFGTDPYWYALRIPAEPLVTFYTDKALRVSRQNGLETQIWLQAYLIPEGREDELANGLRRVVDLGAQHVAVWSYEGSAAMSLLSCERPDRVWDVVGEVYGKIRAE